MPEPIMEFTGQYRFLSNFFPAPILWEGVTWPTSEHLFQASKTTVPLEKDRIRTAWSPAIAKRMGSSRGYPLITKRPDWDEIKFDVMLRILLEKFMQHPDLGALLLGTGDRELVEGNWWNDRIWGMDLKSTPPVGENWLGRLLMTVRGKLRTEVAQWPFEYR